MEKCALAQMSRVKNNFFTYTTTIELLGDEKKPKSPSHMQQLISNPKNLPKLKPYGLKIWKVGLKPSCGQSSQKK